MNKNSQIPRKFRAQGEPDVEASWSAIAMDGHSAMAAMQDGRRSGRFPQNDTHGIELVDRYPDTTGNWRARRAHSKHAPQLENDQRGRDDLPGVIHMLYRKSQIKTAIPALQDVASVGPEAQGRGASSRRRPGMRA
jgi:hypothetical protein